MSQLKSHVKAALKIGVTPIEIKESVYQSAPYIGFPKTLNALEVVNEVFKEEKIELSDLSDNVQNELLFLGVNNG